MSAVERLLRRLDPYPDSGGQYVDDQDRLVHTHLPKNHAKLANALLVMTAG